MDAADFQKTARDAAQIVHSAAMARLAQIAMLPNLDPDLAIKIVRETKDIAQALPKEKADAYANLPVFHIHFGAGGVTGRAGPTTAITATDLGTPAEMVEEVFSMASAVPLPAMVEVASLGVNADVLADHPAPVPPALLPALEDDFDLGGMSFGNVTVDA